MQEPFVRLGRCKCSSVMFLPGSSFRPDLVLCKTGRLRSLLLGFWMGKIGKQVLPESWRSKPQGKEQVTKVSVLLLEV